MSNFFFQALADEPVRQPRPLTSSLSLEEQLVEERWYSYQLAVLLERVAHLAQGVGDFGSAEQALALVREHPVMQAQRQAVADYMDGHPDLQSASCTAGIMQVAEERLKAAGYVLPEGMHLNEVY